MTPPRSDHGLRAIALLEALKGAIVAYLLWHLRQHRPRVADTMSP